MNGDQIPVEYGGGRGNRAYWIAAVAVAVVVVVGAAVAVLWWRGASDERRFMEDVATNQPVQPPVAGGSGSTAPVAGSSLFTTYERDGGTRPPVIISPPAYEPLEKGINRIMTDEEKAKYGFPSDWQVRMTTPKEATGIVMPSFEIISGPAQDVGGEDTSERPLKKPEL